MDLWRTFATQNGAVAVPQQNIKIYKALIKQRVSVQLSVSWLILSNHISFAVSNVLGELDTVGWQKVKVIRCC